MVKPNEMETPLMKITKGAGLVLMGIALSKFISYFYRLALARFLGPADYGLISIGLALINIVVVFAMLGLPAGVMRYTSFYRARRQLRRVRGVITSSLKISLPLSVVISAIIFIFSPFLAVSIFHNATLTPIFQILSAVVIFRALGDLVYAVFRGFQKIRYQVYSWNLFLNASNLFIVILLLILGYGVLGAAWALTISYALTFILAVYFMEKRVFPVITSRIKSIPMKRELLEFSSPLVVVGVLVIMMGYIDTLFLGFFRTPAETGIYNVALPTATLIMISAHSFEGLFGSVLSELWSKGERKEMKSIHNSVTKWMFFINFPLMLLMIMFSGQALNILFGPEYIPGYMALSILAFTFFLRAVIFPASYLLLVIKRTKIILVNTVLAFILNIILNVMLIPVYGIVGAALATAASIILVAVLTNLETGHYFGVFSVSGQFLKSLLAGATSLGMVYYIAKLLPTMNLFYMAALFVLFLVLYSLLLLVLRSFDKNDIEIIKALERRTGLRAGFLRRVARKFVK